MNFSPRIFSDSSCQLSELSSDSRQRSSVDGQSVSYDSVRSLSVSDVELGLKLAQSETLGDCVKILIFAS